MSKVMRSIKLDEDNIYSLDINRKFLMEEENDGSNMDEENLKEQFDAAREEAEKIVEQACNKADEIVREAERRKEKIFEEAKEEGYQKGYEDTIKAAQSEADEIREKASKTVKQAEEKHAQLIRSAEDEVVELAMGIASRVVHEHIQVKPETVVEMVRQSLDKLATKDYYTIFANPQDIELLKQYVEELRQNAGSSSSINFISDETLTLGGCKVETKSGLVDAALESQLEEIRNVLREERVK